MTKFQASVAFRLALGYGALVVATMVVLSAVLYFGTVFMIDREIDAKLSKISQELTDQFETSVIKGTLSLTWAFDVRLDVPFDVTAIASEAISASVSAFE
jgi:hypothetical protein